MSELLDNSKQRVDQLKKLIKDLHNGVSAEDTRKKLSDLMGSVPYGEVVRAEQELINEGLPQEEVLKFCDIHTDALKGKIDVSSAKKVPAGHPVDTMTKENSALTKEIGKIKMLFDKAGKIKPEEDASELLFEIRSIFNSLMDVEKHYFRKENLVFPYLEKYNITGPPMVMWGKHDEVREFLKSSHKLFDESKTVTAEELNGYIEFVLAPAVKAIEEMIYKEEHILFPMCLDAFTEIDWAEIYNQSDEIGYCLISPTEKWTPSIEGYFEPQKKENGKINLSTGSFSIEELEALFSSLPVDLTFVDKDDSVKFFSHGEERIFERNRAILGRKVQFCHPPKSVHIVEQIVNDFKSGKQDSAKFWINFQNKYVHIAYYAVRNANKEYLGTLEVTQDIKQFRDIDGERRLLTYDK
ncbi:MAG: DUF438 domain-containing protein [Ignavibacterium sp.]|nr:DUF438 domain-containing protein [Ignavibacterium sp.]